ncbi:DUF4352 domain-containing protein [Lacticaseibacillus zhaodongensis]|uniref:DUF4352 domain-containing protein n=1 Tax=Lacticaseibacillus zhaodongensis TaxID=2668065 RepID=UPI0018AF7B7C|nr:DUF4352 domain-containing protein [Lacticaseibacillus zhaodongensis]
MRLLKTVAILTMCILPLAACRDDDDDKDEARLQSEVSSLRAENADLRSKLANADSHSEDSASSSSVVSEYTSTTDDDDDDDAARTFARFGALQVTVRDVDSDDVDNEEEDYTPVERSYPDIKNWPAEYFRGEVAYTIHNVSGSTLDLRTLTAELTDGNGRKYERASSDTAAANQFGRDSLAPGASVDGKLYVIGKRSVRLDTFKIHFGAQKNNAGKQVGAGGTIEYR